ncbi:5-(carboxyamino)imidazole ribonucleotide synthase [soil metagenome]
MNDNATNDAIELAPPIVRPPIVPPATVGILGGGPTARYLENIARQMGYRPLILDPNLSSTALLRAAADCDVVTVVDQLPITAMRSVAAAAVPMHPSPEVVDLCTDRIRVKRFLEDLGVGVGPYVLIENEADVAEAANTKFSAILKSRNHGGGRDGQVRVANHGELLAAWETLGRHACVLEQRLMLGRELAITVSRTEDGRIATFAVSQQQYVHGRLDISYAPASLLGSGQADAADLAAYIATELGFVGVLAVHMFVVGREVYVHQLIAQPGPLGLFTLDSCRSDQYEQQLRAVCGLSLGETAMSVPGIAVISLAEELWSAGEPSWERILSDGTVHLHLYDATDAQTRGHLAACSGTAAGSTSVVRRLRKELTSG